MAHRNGPHCYDLYVEDGTGKKFATVRSDRELGAGSLISLNGQIYQITGVEVEYGVAAMKESKVTEGTFAIDVRRI